MLAFSAGLSACLVEIPSVQHHCLGSAVSKSPGGRTIKDRRQRERSVLDQRAKRGSTEKITGMCVQKGGNTREAEKIGE